MGERRAWVKQDKDDMGKDGNERGRLVMNGGVGEEMGNDS